MSSGNLNGKLVGRGFWPACSNCKHNADCKTSPRHSAYPHTWHWGRKAVDIGERTLITVSWVGTISIGAPHTGCSAYSVDDKFTFPLTDKHQKYIELEAEQKRLNRELEAHEKRGEYNRRVEAKYAQLERVYQEQAALAA